METQRETETIVTPFSKDTIEIKSYLTGREKRALTNVYLDNKAISFDVANEEVKGIDYSMIDKAQELAWKTVVVSINGKGSEETDFVEFILDLRSEDYDFVVHSVNDITSDKKLDEEKKTI